MLQLRMHSKILVFCSALLIAGVFPAVVLADDTSESLSFLAENPVIHYGVISALEQDAAAPVVITFDLPSIENSRYADHPAAKTDVHPLLFDLVASADAGTLRLEEAGSGFTLYARMSVAALRALDDNPDILAIELDPNPEIHDSIAVSEFSGISPKLHCPCSPVIGSTMGCVSSNRWRVTVNHGGTSSKVAKYGGSSVAFWTYSSGNWEVLAKVLNGCAINNRWWVYAAGATGSSYTLTVGDAVGLCSNTKTYNSSSYSGGLIIDTAAFTCP